MAVYRSSCLAPGTFIPRHGNEFCCREAPAVPEPLFQGSSGHGPPGELDSLTVLPCPPARPAVTQFPFPRTRVTQHPTFAWLWEVKQ